MHNPRSPARAKPSQVPTLPQLVAPWQHEETTPNRPLLKPHTSPCQPGHPPDKTASSFPSSDVHHSFTELEKQGKVSGAIKRLEDLESRIAGLEQANLLRSLGRNPTPADSGRERGRVGGQVGLERLLSEMASHLKRLEERVLQNEQRILRGEAQSIILVQLTQDTERKVTETQRELAAKREEQGAGLEGLRERVHQLEQRQLQLANFSQGSQERLAAQLRRVGEETRRLNSRVETMSGSVGGKMNALEHRHSVLEGSMQGVSGAVMGLNRANAELNTRLTEVRTGLSEVKGRLGRDKEKRDTQLRESFLGVQSELGRTAAHLQELFLDHLQENSAKTGTQISELQDQVLEAMSYSKQECRRERDNLRRELETRISATEEATEAEKRECEARLKDLHSAVVEDCGKIRSELTKELKAKLQQRGEEGRKVLQGAVSVVEEEAKVSRQELLSVLEAEIRTRSEEVEKMCAEQQRLFRELHMHSQSVKTSMEATEQTAKADREQVRLLQDSLAGQWQEIGVRLLADIDSRLSAVTTFSPHHPIHPSSQQCNSNESPPRHLTPYLPVRGRAPGQTQTPGVGTPFSQASYLVEDDDDRGEGEGRGAELSEKGNQDKDNGASAAAGASLSLSLQQHLTTQKNSNPLHSKSRILQLLPHDRRGSSQGNTTNRHTGGGDEGRELFSVAEEAESGSIRDHERDDGSTSPTSETGSEAVKEGVGREGETKTHGMDASAAPGGTRHTAANSPASRNAEFGTTGSELNSCPTSSSGLVPTNLPRPPADQQEKAGSPAEPPVYDTNWRGTPSEMEWSVGKPQSHSSEGEVREGEEEVGEKSDTSKEEAEGGSSSGSGEGEKVVWTIGEPRAND